MTGKPEYPNDADGDALRRVVALGADMSKPMEIDFAITVPSREAGVAVAEHVRRLGFRVKLVPDADEEEPDATSWSCYCSKVMLAGYEPILAVQRQLDSIAEPWGGRSDGWGTAGNASSAG